MVSQTASPRPGPPEVGREEPLLLFSGLKSTRLRACINRPGVSCGFCLCPPWCRDAQTREHRARISIPPSAQPASPPSHPRQREAERKVKSCASPTPLRPVCRSFPKLGRLGTSRGGMAPLNPTFCSLVRTGAPRREQGWRGIPVRGGFPGEREEAPETRLPRSHLHSAAGGLPRGTREPGRPAGTDRARGSGARAPPAGSRRLPVRPGFGAGASVRAGGRRAGEAAGGGRLEPGTRRRRRRQRPGQWLQPWRRGARCAAGSAASPVRLSPAAPTPPPPGPLSGEEADD